MTRGNGAVTEPPTIDPGARTGQTSETWGNLLLPDGQLGVNDRFRFQGEGDRVMRVLRVLSWPLDSKRRLVYYESVDRLTRPVSPEG